MTINLTATTHTLEIETGAAVATHVVVSGRNKTAAGVETPISEQFVISTATDTVVTSAPAASEQKTIDDIEISVQGSGTQTLRVMKDVSATEFTMIGPLSIGTGERAHYTNDMGWRVFDTFGREKAFAMGYSQLAAPVYVTATNAALPTLLGATAMLIRGWAPGGGGGGANTLAANTAVGNGGSSGGYFEKFVIGVPATISITIGAVGAAGAAAGGNGGTTAVVAGSTTLTANGGIGGIGMTPAAGTDTITAETAPGATSTGGDLNSPGNGMGTSAMRLVATVGKAGSGGESTAGVGSPGAARVTTGTGIAGVGFNAGGSGGASINGGAASAGVVGLGGLVEITYFTG